MTCPDGFNDPARDSLFLKVNDRVNECSLCGTRVGNCTEARDAHLNEEGCHVRAAGSEEENR